MATSVNANTPTDASDTPTDASDTPKERRVHPMWQFLWRERACASAISWLALEHFGGGLGASKVGDEGADC